MDARVCCTLEKGSTYNIGYRLQRLFPSSATVCFRPGLYLGLGPQRRDSFGIDTPMTLAVVFLDVLEVGRFFDARDIPVHVLQPPVQFWVAMSDTRQHEFEVLLIYCIEPYQRRVELDVDLSRLCCAEYEGGQGSRYHFLETIQRFKDDSAILFVIFLGVCEACFVHSSVKIRHHPTVHLFNLVSQLRRIGVEVPSPIALWQKMVKCMVQHAHDIFTLIVHDLVRLLIPEYWHAVLTLVVWIRPEVDLVQKVGVEEMVDRATKVFVIGRGKAPTAIVFRVWLHNTHGQEFLQTL